MQFTDEHLNQLIDGELSPIEETQLRAAMAEDAELGVRGVLHVHVPHVSLADLQKSVSTSLFQSNEIT